MCMYMYMYPDRILYRYIHIRLRTLFKRDFRIVQQVKQVVRDARQ